MKMQFTSYVFGIIIALHIANAATWDTSLLPGSRLEVCQGQNINFPWRITMSVGEQMSNWKWERNQLNHTSVDGGNRQYTNEAGKSVFSNDSRFTFGPERQLKITGATVDDTGSYTITVNVSTANATTVTYPNSVSLLVKASPKMVNGALQVKLDRSAMVKDGPGAALLHMRLSCGEFQNSGQPNVSVLWTIPSGRTQPSTVYQNGFFFLSVPVYQFKPGRYSCWIDPQAKAFDCVENGSPLRSRVTVDVSSADIHMSLLRNELQTLELEKRTRDQEIQNGLQTLEAEKTQIEATCSTKIANLEGSESVIHTKLTDRDSQEKELMQNMIPVWNSVVNWMNRFESCLEAKRVYPKSGVRTICITSVCFEAYCDQDSDGGGWTVFQLRKDGSVNFNKDYQAYRHGFGEASGEYWLGLEKILLLTASGLTSLRIDMWDQRDQRRFARYGTFNIDGVQDNYRLRVDDYWGDAGDSLRWKDPSDAWHNNGQPFSTRDLLSNGNACAQTYQSGWWFHACFHANLNGPYNADEYGVSWGLFSWTLKRSEMKVR